MTEKTTKRLFIYQIFTTTELGETVYSTAKIRIMGNFVKFNPYQIQTRFESADNKKDTIFILPERVIKKILRVDVAEQLTKTSKKTLKEVGRLLRESKDIEK